MKSRTRSLLLSCLILTSGSACTTIELAAPLPCPERPLLTPVPEDLQIRIPEDALLILAENQATLKAYARKLEGRAGCDL